MTARACAALLWIAATLCLAEDAPQLAEGVDVPHYNQIGRDLVGQLGGWGKAFVKGDLATLSSAVADVPCVGPARAALELAPPLSAWTVGPGAELPLEAFWSTWRARWKTVDEVLFKLDRIEEVSADGWIEARARFEVVGEGAEGGRLLESFVVGGRWRERPGESPLPAALRVEGGQGASGPGDLLVDEAAARGISFFGRPDSRFLPPSKALRYQVIRHAVGGASAGDIDGDGFDDLLLTSGEGLRLFRCSPAGQFSDVTDAAGLGGLKHVNVGLFADFDNDGDADLFLGRFYGANQLFQNDGAGRFTDVTAASGLEADDMTAVACALDADGDGLLDLYLGRFLDAKTEVPDAILYTRNGAKNRLYRGKGGLAFEDVSAASGADDEGLTLGVGAADYDEDGDQDLYLSNDYGRNVFLQNQGDGTFRDVALDNGTLAISGGMSVAWGDVDGDAKLDLYVSSIRSNQRWFSEDVNIRRYVLNIVQSQRRERLQALFLDMRKHLGEDWDQVGKRSLAGNYLMRQTEGGRFEDVSWEAGARPPGWYWSSGFHDLDNDGRVDVLAINGWITGKEKDDL
ncbi:MAG: VCBS repeat-containing protein [Planctomycetes bacterium]|nr:VCBS repeat-containing protein [Planctomycetota bacterium]